MKTVLVVDDDSEILEMVKVVLEEKGLNIATAKDGKACMREIIVKKPDLIIMDLKMPNMDGLNALDLIRVTQMNRQVPILMWSGDTDPEVIARATRLGADDFLSKSTPMPEFTKIVEQHLFSLSHPELVEVIRKCANKVQGALQGGFNSADHPGWDCYPVSIREVELCVLLKEGLAPDKAAMLSAADCKDQVKVMQKLAKRWRQVVP
jgi:CheY-like chemotaxis protein